MLTLPYHTLHEFLDEWGLQRTSTAKIFHALTNESLGQEETPGGRTLGGLAWHIVRSVRMQLLNAGVSPDEVDHDAPQPGTAAAIAAAYDTDAEMLAVRIATHWTDASLAEHFTQYGREWTRAAALRALVMHQAHHRGQMTILMRQAGLRVPGIVGPSREERAAMIATSKP